MARERGARELVGVDETVRRFPAAQPAASARTERTGEMRIRLEEIGRGSRGGHGVRVEEGSQEREIVLRLVDGDLRVGGRRPAESRASRLLLGAPRDR